MAAFGLPLENPDSPDLDVPAPLAVDVAFDVVPAALVAVVAAGVTVDVAWVDNHDLGALVVMAGRVDVGRAPNSEGREDDGEE